MIVQEQGKYYKIDEDTGLVTEASAEDLEGVDVVNADEHEEEFRRGDRVEVGGRLGEVISVLASMYGPAIGVRFDDGDVEEYPEGVLKRSDVEKPDYASPCDEVMERFAKYASLPALTDKEIDAKEAEARALNLRARSLITDTKLAFSCQNDLHQVVLVTGTDLHDLKDLRDNTEENQRYVESFNRYRVPEEISTHGGTSMGAKGDASWLHTATDDLEVRDASDKFLAARATDVVSQLSREQLEDDQTMRMSADFELEYLNLDETGAKKFASYLEGARRERLKEKETKTASTEESFDDIQDEAIYF